MECDLLLFVLNILLDWFMYSFCCILKIDTAGKRNKNQNQAFYDLWLSY